MGEFIFVCSVGIWLGTVVSFLYLFVPISRATLHRETALDLLGSLFPRFYMLGLLCGLTGLAGISLAPSNLSIPLSERILLAFPVSVALICTVLAQYYVHPKIVEARDQDPEDYDRLLRLSAVLNNTVLVMLISTFATFTLR